MGARPGRRSAGKLANENSLRPQTRPAPPNTPHKGEGSISVDELDAFSLEPRLRRIRRRPALARLTGVIDKLLVYPERMARNMNRMGGLIHSQRVLLALTQAGASREEAYRLVQRNAMKVWESDGALSLLDLLKGDPEVTALLSPEQIEERFDLDYHLKHVDTIFARVFGS